MFPMILSLTLNRASAAEDGQHFHLVLVSTIVKRYGIQTLIKAVPLLLKDIPELKIDIIGEGEHRPDLEQLARELGVDEVFEFYRIHPLRKCPGLYSQRAHIGLAPMIEDVGAPNKIFEYFALGKATIASAQPSFKALFDESCISYFPARQCRGTGRPDSGAIS